MPRWVLAGGTEVDDRAFAARRPRHRWRGTRSGRHGCSPRISAPAATGPRTPVIGILPGKIITPHLTFDIPPVNGDKRPDLSRDLMKIAVIERHGRERQPGDGFVQGFGMRAGAIARRSAMTTTTSRLRCRLCRHGTGRQPPGRDRGRFRRDSRRQGAGGTVAAGGGVDEPCVLRDRARGAGRPARRRPQLGVVLEEPFLQLAFLALPVNRTSMITTREWSMSTGSR